MLPAWPGSLSEWSQVSGPDVTIGATKQRPGGASGEEASGHLHGSGPSSLLLYADGAGVGPPGWKVDVSRWTGLAAATGIKAAIL